MPAELLQTRRRYLSIQDGRMKERNGETVNEFNILSRVFLIDVTYREVEKEENGVKRVVGKVIQLHLLDDTDYYILETWVNSAYARAFYQMMQNLELNRAFTIITAQKIVNTKKRPALFLKQDGFSLTWCYTKDNMQDCPPLEVRQDHQGKTVYDDTLQMMFFLRLVDLWLVPAVHALPNPFPNHPIFEDRRNENFSSADTMAGTTGTGPEDDLPF